MHVLLTNFTKILDYKGVYNVVVWRHKQRTPSNNDQRTPLVSILSKFVWPL